MQTVGELRKALEICPDETPLAVLIDRWTAKVVDNEILASGKFEIEIDGQHGATITGF